MPFINPARLLSSMPCYLRLGAPDAVDDECPHDAKDVACSMDVSSKWARILEKPVYDMVDRGATVLNAVVLRLY